MGIRADALSQAEEICDNFRINRSQRPGKKQTDFSDLFVYQEYAHDYEMDEVSTLEEIQEEILRRANDPKYLRLDEKGCSKLLTIIAPE